MHTQGFNMCAYEVCVLIKKLKLNQLSIYSFSSISLFHSSDSSHCILFSGPTTMIAHFYINRVYLSNLYRLLDEDGGRETVEPHLSFGEEGGGDGEGGGD